MVSLLWRFIGDLNPLNRAFRQAEGKAQESGSAAGKAFGAQFKSAVLRFVGAGALISQVNKLMQDAVKVQAGAMKEGVGVVAYQELERMADLTGTTIEQLRELSEKLPGPFTELANAVRQSGGMLDAETVNQLSDAAFGLKEFTRDLAPLVAGLMRGLNWIVNGTKAVAAKAFEGGFKLMRDIPGTDKRFWNARANVAASDASESWNNMGGSFLERSRERTAASGFMGAAHNLRAQRAQLAGSIVGAMPGMERAITGASVGVPFFGKVGEEMLKELRKSTEELKELSKLVNQKL